MKSLIKYSTQSITSRDENAVVKAVTSEYLTQGPLCVNFEKALSAYVGAKYGCVFNSATSALHAACLALETVPGDIVWTSGISFVASANAAKFCGAKIDFYDVDRLSGNVCLQKLEEKLLTAEASKQLPKVIIIVHMAGHPCDVSAVVTLARRFDVKIIEDASHALGACVRGAMVGSGGSDMVVFSFHPLKIITTAEGGIVTTNSDVILNKLKLVREHGIIRGIGGKSAPWEYDQVALGYNLRMTELQAALGLSQLERIEEMHQARCILANRYIASLEALPLLLPPQRADYISSWHLFIIHCKQGADQRLSLYNYLHQNNIACAVHYRPIYKNTYYRNLGFPYDYLVGCEQYYEGCLSLPLHPGLKYQDQDRIIGLLDEFLR